MSITTQWMNDEHTVLMISYGGIIGEQDFIDIMEHVHEQIAGSAQPVHIIHDYGNSNAQELLNQNAPNSALAS